MIAWDGKEAIPILDLFPLGEALSFDAFFRRLAEIGDRCEDVILPYEVVTTP
ncbi:MAG: hypothetical protein QM278_07815 [Pseudomonadota bacterium]|nr:hypothetical protein [Pseudomonadota bacterium]